MKRKSSKLFAVQQEATRNQLIKFWNKMIYNASKAQSMKFR